MDEMDEKLARFRAARGAAPAEVTMRVVVNPPPVIDSDVTIRRDTSRVDCYIIDPGEHAVSIPATLFVLLAQAVRVRGEAKTIGLLQDLRDYAE